MTDDDEQGRGGLGAKVAGLARRALPQRDTVGRNAVAGLTVTVGNLPSAMANGLLAGVNPLYGLYANMVGPIVGGALASNPLMVVNSTSAAALVVGQSLTGVPSDEQESALFLTVVLAGALMVLFGVLGLGRLLRFVSFSVMTGFVAGIAVTLTLSQLPTITGTSPEGSTEVAQTVDLLGNLDAVDLRTLGLAVLTLALAATLPHTPLDKVASLLAIVVPTVLVALLGLDDVQVVSDVSEISGGLPLPVLPALSAFSPDVVTAAFAVAVVVLAQGAGVSQSVSGSDSGRSSPSRDFVAQGAGNVVAGFFRGLPVGGSLSGTVLNLSSGARGRWAVIFSGLWMIVVVVAFAGVVSLVAMPALAALLVFAGLQSIKPSDVAEVWRAGWLARVGAIVTFVATILLPIQVAVVIGIVLAGLLYVLESSTDISVVALVQRPDGAIEEQQPPERLPGGEVTVLDVYGDLFYAGARTLERRLPQPGDDRARSSSSGCGAVRRWARRRSRCSPGMRAGCGPPRAGSTSAVSTRGPAITCSARGWNPMRVCRPTQRRPCWVSRPGVPGTTPRRGWRIRMPVTVAEGTSSHPMTTSIEHLERRTDAPAAGTALLMGLYPGVAVPVALAIAELLVWPAGSGS